MKPFFLIFTIWCYTSSIASLQPLKAWERAGDAAFQQKDYGAAIQYYNTFLQREEDDLGVWWKYADCARLFNAYSEAEKGYNKIANSEKSQKRYPLLDYRLGEIKKSQGDYNDAIRHFEKFLHDTSGPGIELRDDALREVASLRDAQTRSKSTRLNSSHLDLSRMPSSA